MAARPTRKVDLLNAGDEVNIKMGEFQGKLARIVDPTIQGPDTPYQRKLLVEVDGEEVYILPRFLDMAAWTPTVSPVNPSVPTVGLPVQAGAPASPATATGPIIGALPAVAHLDHPMFDPYRPNSLLAAEYVSRKMSNGDLDIDFLLSFFHRKPEDGGRRNLMLVGDTQAGKTMLVHVLAIVLAKQLGYAKPLPVFTLSGSAGVTDFDMFGQPTAYTDEHGVERIVWLPGVVDLAARYGGFLYLDEVNMMPERVTSSLHPLCDFRKTFVNRQNPVPQQGGGFLPEQVQAHEHLWVVGTINPGYRGAGALQEAFSNRFTWVAWGYDQATEDALIPLNTVRVLGQALREAREARIISTPIGTSSLVEVCRNARQFGAAMAIELVRAMFSLAERQRFDAIVEDRSILMLLDDEVRADGLNVTK